MNTALIAATLKTLVTLGCPGFEDLQKPVKIIWDDVNYYSNGSAGGGNDSQLGGGWVNGSYSVRGSGGGTTTILVKTKEGYESLENVCTSEKEKLRKLLWEKK